MIDNLQVPFSDMTNTSTIPFNWPFMTGNELDYIAQSHSIGRLAGDGPFTKKCHEWLEHYSSSTKVLLTHSCTAALEMAALLLDIKPGDEVILPSFTFVSTANAFVLRGATPVFVDIREDTLNINEQLIETAISSKTVAIIVVHYAGVSCEMDKILEVAKIHDLAVVEDAAQGIMSSYKGKPLGSIGNLGAFSFHETKNIISGEGGSLLINADNLTLRAEIIREKGTDRSQFFRGSVDKYTWQDIGSSFLPGELTAAFLWAQLEQANFITQKRLNIWDIYHKLLAPLEQQGLIRRPIIPNTCQHNAHMYYVLLSPETNRNKILDLLRKDNIHAVFHYVPLHSSPVGLKLGRISGSMEFTDMQSERLIRLPLWIGLTENQQISIVNALSNALFFQ